MIADEKQRNRAIHGDLVAIQLLPETDWLPITRAQQQAEAELGPDGPALREFVSGDTLARLAVAVGADDSEEALRQETKRKLWLPNERMLQAFRSEGTTKRSAVHPIDDRARRSMSQPTCKVVAILEATHCKTVVGALSVKDPSLLRPGCPLAESVSHVYFQPHEALYPRLLVPRLALPEHFLGRPLEGLDKIYQADIVEDWPVHSKMPFGEKIRSLGEACSIHVETEALLLEHHCSHGLFTEEMLAPLRDLLGDQSIDSTSRDANWRIPAAEMARRRDLRNYRIFTIDPTNAKDLDDALHVTPMSDGTYELGVHIADVSYFIAPNSPLDAEAAHRATSVYLVQKVVPMLPPILCEQLCSLNPNVDRLAFSCIFRMNADGTLVEGHEPWFGRTVIRSCAKLDYATAQRMVDGDIPSAPTPSPSDPDGFLAALSESVWQAARHPVGHAAWQCAHDVVLMHRIAMSRRSIRKGTGALTLFGTKLAFQLDGDGNPGSVAAYPVKESNQLVEEYMLLANALVAGKLIEKVGRSGFLRMHPPPLPDGLKEVEALATACNLPFDTTSARTIQESLNHITRYADEQTVQVITALLMVPMKPAQYLVAGSVSSEDWAHYALNIPYYTHFTSPIRRFADVCVHRLLDIAVSAPDTVIEDAYYKQLQDAAEHCNFMKENSQKAQRRSDAVFLAIFLKDRPLDVRGIVIGVGEKSFTVLVPEYGVQDRIMVDEMPGVTADFDLTRRSLRLHRSTADPETGRAPEAVNNSRRTPNTLTFVGDLTLGIMSEVMVHLSAKMAPPPIDVRISLVGLRV